MLLPLQRSNQKLTVKNLSKKTVKELLNKNPTISFDDMLKELVGFPEERHRSKLREILKSMKISSNPSMLEGHSVC